MVYYKKTEWTLYGFIKSNTKNKMYDGIIINKKSGKTKRVPFGDIRYENFRDMTGLNLYPHLIHNNPDRRKSFKSRHTSFLKEGYYSPSYFSFYYLW